MNILFIGDIVGRPARNAIAKVLPGLKEEMQIDLIFANGENLTSGNGMTFDVYKDMINLGIDYFTSGNHIWDKKDFIKYLDEKDIKVIRPANYPESVPGKSIAEIKFKNHNIILINLLGRVFIPNQTDNPFLVVDEILKKIKNKIIIVDFHAEATSEKNCMGYYLDGRVSAVIGTHTHIPTADARILPKKTAYISDTGMVGLLDSAIGCDLDSITQSFLTGLPFQSKSSPGKVFFNATFLKINEKNGKAKDIKLIQKIID